MSISNLYVYDTNKDNFTSDIQKA